MEHPKTLSGIFSGRMQKDEYIKLHYPEFYVYLNENYPDTIPFNEKLYWFYNGLTSHPTCKTCGKSTPFISNSRGYAGHCTQKCTQQDKNVRDKLKESCIEKYGNDYKTVIYNKGKSTKLQRYGDENYNNIDKLKKTCLEKYGVDNPQKVKEIREKTKNTCLEKYGAEYYQKTEEFKNRYDSILEKSKKTCLEKYGVDNPMKLDSVKEKTQKTCLDKYGVPWNCMRKEAHHSKNMYSIKNEDFAKLLDQNNIKYEREYCINKYSYDFKIDNILVEINPTATHNINWNPYKKDSKEIKIDKNYHLYKTKLAENNGFKCIHVWDWDNINTIIGLLLPKETIYARECVIKEVNKKETEEFLLNNHIQGTCKRQTVRLGLYKDNKLVQLMTFGKPRYNKHYEYELLRLCSDMQYVVIGGANKLFKYFIDNYSPNSIISYCDISKFDGKIYNIIGMNLLRVSKPACVWANCRSKKFITDAELRKHGADQILGTSYGKGTDNKEIMIKHRWAQVYNCGQKTFVWNKNI